VSHQKQQVCQELPRELQAASWIIGPTRKSLGGAMDWVKWGQIPDSAIYCLGPNSMVLVALAVSADTLKAIGVG
jgi:hypothetical protein